MSLLRLAILAALLVAALFMGLVQGMDDSGARTPLAYRLATVISAEQAEDAARTAAARRCPDPFSGHAIDFSGMPLGDEVLAIPQVPGDGSGTSPRVAPDWAPAAHASATTPVPLPPDTPDPGAETTMPPATSAVPATSAAPDNRRTSDAPIDAQKNPLGHSLPTPAPTGSKP